MKSPLSLMLLMLAACSLTAADSEPLFERPLPELMDAETFAATGLSKLSQDELAKLQAWLEDAATERSRQRIEAAVESEVSRKVREKAAEQGVVLFDTPTAERFESRIAGRLDALRGKGQLLNLENGQTWRLTQSVSRRLELDSPEVYIRSGLAGSYLMTLRGYSGELRVERVK
jgi:hypothetical protein